MKFFTKEVKIALIALVGIVVLFYGLQFLKGLNVFSSDSSYYVAFDDVSGLSSSSPVYANGYRVGVVKSLSYDYNPQGKIIAELGLDNNMRVPQGSHAELASDLLGNIKINLVLSFQRHHMENLLVLMTLLRKLFLFKARNNNKLYLHYFYTFSIIIADAKKEV